MVNASGTISGLSGHVLDSGGTLTLQKLKPRDFNHKETYLYYVTLYYADIYFITDTG